MERNKHWRILLRHIAVGVLLVVPSLLRAGEIIGVVASIHDGDSLTVMSAETQIKVRLSEIDAPELGQPFGTRSRQSLGELCHKREAHIVEIGTDRYGRTLGRVHCDGLDANAEQVRRGMAWVFDRYVTDRGLYSLQEAAQAARLGLWSDQQPVAPWEWRQRRDLKEAR